jgi:hypothetical protein
MSKFVHGLLQVLGFLVSIGTLATGAVPVPYNALVVAGVSLGQATLALVNHKTVPPVVP